MVHYVIEMKDVEKSFFLGTERINIFTDLFYQCRENSFSLIKGPSGCGKSTLIALIAGLTLVNSGSIRVFDHDLHAMNTESLAIFRSMTIGIVFQMGHLISSLTIKENILLPVVLTERDEYDYEQRANNLMKEFSLIHRKNSLPRQVSGGEFQRAAFVRALILDPPLLLVDEATSNQDQKTRQVIIDKLTELKGKKTIVVISHEPEIEPLADQTHIPIHGCLQQI
ncbi:ABC transporter ATP-binding protein [Candidatus Hodarchaeum mangrovi]